MTKALLLAVPLSAAFALTPLLAAPTTITRDFMTTSFESVTIDGDIAATLTHGTNAKIVATGASGDIDRLSVVRNGRSLRIAIRPAFGSSYARMGPVSLALSSADVENVAINGNAVMAIDRLEQQELALAIGGPGVLTVGSARADNVTITMIGNGSVTIGGGDARKATVTMDGAGRLAMTAMPADSVFLTTTGPVSVEANARRDATVRAFGTGSIRISGGASCRILYAAQASVECGGGYRNAE